MKTGIAGRVAQTFLASKLTPLLIMGSLVAGLGGVLTTPREEEPQISVPMIDVFLAAPGSSALEIERRSVERGRGAEAVDIACLARGTRYQRRCEKPKIVRIASEQVDEFRPRTICFGGQAVRPKPRYFVCKLGCVNSPRKVNESLT